MFAVYPNIQISFDNDERSKLADCPDIDCAASAHVDHREPGNGAEILQRSRAVFAFGGRLSAKNVIDARRIRRRVGIDERKRIVDAANRKVSEKRAIARATPSEARERIRPPPRREQSEAGSISNRPV